MDNNIIINREADGEKIIKKLRNGRKNVIFGAGSIGSLFKDVMDRVHIDIDSFLVNDGYKKTNKYKGIRIYELNEFPFNIGECNIIYSVFSNDLEILKDLYYKFNKDIIYIDGMKTIFNLLNIYYNEYFKKNNIDINKDIIEIKDIKFINPFFIDEECVNSFLFEIGDLILPNVLNDYTMINEGPYEYGNVVLNEGDIVFDCGANIGIFSSIAAAKRCICYSFEPVLSTVNYLNKTSELYPNYINVCKYALGDYNGQSKLYISQDTNISNSLSALNQSKDNYINVTVKTIDDFVRENNILRIDFIKADIEGAERYMLLGAKETLARFSPKLSICTYHLKDDPEVLEKIILDCNKNYIVEHRWKKLYAYIPGK